MARMSGWICQDEYKSKLNYLTDTELGRLTRAMINYHIDGSIPESMGREIGAFYFIKADIDSAEEKYENKSKQNKKNRNGGCTNDYNGEQTLTNDDERARPLTNDDERGRTCTNKNMNMNINENDKYEEEEEERARARLIDPDWKMVADAYQAQIGMLPMGNALDVLISYVDDLHGETVVKAIEITNEKTPDNPHQFLIAILKNFEKNGIDSREKAEAYLKDRERRIANDSRGRAQVRGAYQTTEIVRGSRTATGNADGEGGETLSPSERSIRESFDEYLRSTHI